MPLPPDVLVADLSGSLVEGTYVRVWDATVARASSVKKVRSQQPMIHATDPRSTGDIPSGSQFTVIGDNFTAATTAVFAVLVPFQDCHFDDRIPLSVDATGAPHKVAIEAPAVSGRGVLYLSNGSVASSAGIKVMFRQP